MRGFRYPARKQELLRFQARRGDPGRDRVACLLGDLKLDRALGLLLHDHRPRHDPSALDHIVDAESNQIAAAQLAVDGEVEQREFPRSMIQLQPNPDSPDLFQLQWGPGQAAAAIP